MTLSRSHWEKLLLRWSGMHPTGEVKLICAVIADGICDVREQARFFQNGGLAAYCSAIGLDVDFIKQQIDRAEAA